MVEVHQIRSFLLEERPEALIDHRVGVDALETITVQKIVGQAGYRDRFPFTVGERQLGMLAPRDAGKYMDLVALAPLRVAEISELHLGPSRIVGEITADHVSYFHVDPRAP